MVAFEDQWAQIKRETSASAGMNLASANGKGGSGDSGRGGVKSSKNAWSTAAGAVGSLRGDIKTALTKLEQGQKPAAGGDSGSGGVRSAVAQQELYRSWKRYLEDVSGRCGVMQDRLEKAGDHHYKNDQAIEGVFAGLDKRYKDTAPVGGETRGR